MDLTNGISLRERIRLNLLTTMENTGLNQVQLADKLGISKGTVNNWVRGNNSPDVDMVPRICEVLGISILSLYSPTKFEVDEEASASHRTGEAGMEDPLHSALLRNFGQLNQEGRERLVDYSDDLVSSGKYIKSNPAKLDKTQGA